MDINSIKAPKIIEELSFEQIKEELVNLIKTKLPNYMPLESDRYTAVLEAVAYRELILRARINKCIESTLLPTATGTDLDNVVAMYGISRIKGTKPRATVRLILNEMFVDNDKILPKGTVFTNKKHKVFSRLTHDVVLAPGMSHAVVVLELDEYVTDSQVKTESLVNPVDYVLSVEQADNVFMGGATPESDEAFRIRAIKSLDRYSTTGSVESYQYHALSAHPKIEDVYIENKGAGVVGVKVHFRAVDNEEAEKILKQVSDYLSSDKIRPLTDRVIVEKIKVISKTIKAKYLLNGTLTEGEVRSRIEDNFENLKLRLGEGLNLSFIYKNLHVDGVHKITLEEPSKDISVMPDECVEVTLDIAKI